jgi:signal transduction histidine kinase
VSDTRRLWVHAARVAIAATVVVAASYALCALGLRAFVTHRLTAEVDGRIHVALAGARGLSVRPSPATPAGAPTDSGDLDDAPIFFWYVPSHGRPLALTLGAPRLPRGSWSASPITRAIGVTAFRFEATPRGDGWIVAGQSIAEIARVEGALVIPEMLFGILLALATFVGALLVALRASTPLEQIRRRQAEFTADASHELRTPLSVVEAEVDLALRRPRSPEEYEAVLRRIASESRRLRRIVDDLLWLARADSGTETQATQVADVEAVVASCVDRFEAVAARSHVSLAFSSVGEGSGMVEAPPELIDRLAGVLVDNACKYAGDGGAVSVVVQTTPSRVVLRVDDSGPGIPPDQRSAVFDRFHRATSVSGGSGLGLAIADSVVRMTGGTWSVREAPLGGARMEVSWRAAPGDDRAPRSARSLPGAPPMSSSEAPALRRDALLTPT